MDSAYELGARIKSSRLIKALIIDHAKIFLAGVKFRNLGPSDKSSCKARKVAFKVANLH